MSLRVLDLFSGVGGFSLGFERAGFETVAFSEIEPFSCSVLAHHWPDVPNLGDITKITEEWIETLGRIDVVTFGSPCQDFSVAGKRLGMKGQRSSLFHEAVRVIRGVGPTFAVFENVPGLFSSAAGWDFAAVLDEMADLGALDIAWRVLDAQNFGVPQRRRRVFLVADFAGERAGEILFEPEGVRGNSQAGREAGERIADSLTVGANQYSGFNGEPVAVAGGITARYGKGTDSDATDTLVTHALTGEGFDASEDGTGRGTPLVPLMASGAARSNGAGIGRDQDPAFTLDTTGAQAVAFALRGREDGAQLELSGEQTSSIRSSSGGSSRDYVAFQQNTRDEVRLMGGDGRYAGALAAEPGMKQQNYIAFHSTQDPISGDVSPALGTGNQQGISTTALSAPGMAVRRLTPLECERLMGLKDSWTGVPHRGKPAADGPRYRACGNGVAVPVVEWIAHRIGAALGEEVA